MIRTTMMLLIRGYQKFISPCLPPMCRFRPTCSQYFLEALQKRGLFKGTWLGIYRLLRCHPFCEGGYDPVPEKEINIDPREEERENV